jgi:hypothetical protein
MRSAIRFSLETGVAKIIARLNRSEPISYIDDDGNEEIYWFPAEEVVDGDTGGVEYVPLSS